MDKPQIIEAIRKAIFPLQDGEGNVVGTCFAVGQGYMASCRHVFYDRNMRERANLTVSIYGHEYVPDYKHPDRVEADLVILQFNDLPTHEVIELGDFERIREGDDVLFTGFPLQSQHHVTHHGMISAKGSSRLQIDASVNKGNSGGPCIALQDGKPVCVGVIASKMVELDHSKFHSLRQAMTATMQKYESGDRFKYNMALIVAGTLDAIGPGFNQLDRLVNVGFGEAESVDYPKRALSVIVGPTTIN